MAHLPSPAHDDDEVPAPDSRPVLALNPADEPLAPAPLPPEPATEPAPEPAALPAALRNPASPEADFSRAYGFDPTQLAEGRFRDVLSPQITAIEGERKETARAAAEQAREEQRTREADARKQEVQDNADARKQQRQDNADAQKKQDEGNAVLEAEMKRTGMQSYYDRAAHANRPLLDEEGKALFHPKKFPLTYDAEGRAIARSRDEHGTVWTRDADADAPIGAHKGTPNRLYRQNTHRAWDDLGPIDDNLSHPDEATAHAAQAARTQREAGLAKEMAKGFKLTGDQIDAEELAARAKYLNETNPARAKIVAEAQAAQTSPALRDTGWLGQQTPVQTAARERLAKSQSDLAAFDQANPAPDEKLFKARRAAVPLQRGDWDTILEKHAGDTEAAAMELRGKIAANGKNPDEHPALAHLDRMRKGMGLPTTAEKETKTKLRENPDFAPVMQRADALEKERQDVLARGGATPEEATAMQAKAEGVNAAFKEVNTAAQARQATAEGQRQKVIDARVAVLDAEQKKTRAGALKTYDPAFTGRTTRGEDARLADSQQERAALEALSRGDHAAYLKWEATQPKDDADVVARLQADRDSPAVADARSWSKLIGAHQGVIDDFLQRRQDIHTEYNRRMAEPGFWHKAGALWQSGMEQAASGFQAVQGLRNTDIDALAKHKAARDAIGDFSGKEAVEIFQKAAGYAKQLAAGQNIADPTEPPMMERAKDRLNQANEGDLSGMTLGVAQSWLNDLKADREKHWANGGLETSASNLSREAWKSFAMFFEQGRIHIDEADKEQVAKRKALLDEINRVGSEDYGKTTMAGGALGSLASFVTGGAVARLAVGKLANIGALGKTLKLADDAVKTERKLDFLATAANYGLQATSGSWKQNPEDMGVLARLADVSMEFATLAASEALGNKGEHAINRRFGSTLGAWPRLVIHGTASGAGEWVSDMAQDLMKGEVPHALEYLATDMGIGFGMAALGFRSNRRFAKAWKAREAAIGGLTPYLDGAAANPEISGIHPDALPHLQGLRQQAAKLRAEIAAVGDDVEAQHPLKGQLFSNLRSQNELIEHQQIAAVLGFDETPGGKALGAQSVAALPVQLAALDTQLAAARSAGDAGQIEALTTQRREVLRGAMVSRQLTEVAADIDNITPATHPSLAAATPEQVAQTQHLARGLVKIARGMPLDALLHDEQVAVSGAGVDGKPYLDPTPVKGPDGKPMRVITQPVIERLATISPAAARMLRSEGEVREGIAAAAAGTAPQPGATPAQTSAARPVTAAPKGWGKAQIEGPTGTLARTPAASRVTPEVRERQIAMRLAVLERQLGPRGTQEAPLRELHPDEVALVQEWEALQANPVQPGEFGQPGYTAAGANNPAGKAHALQAELTAALEENGHTLTPEDHDQVRKASVALAPKFADYRAKFTEISVILRSMNTGGGQANIGGELHLSIGDIAAQAFERLESNPRAMEAVLDEEAEHVFLRSFMGQATTEALAGAGGADVRALLTAAEWAEWEKLEPARQADVIAGRIWVGLPVHVQRLAAKMYLDNPMWRYDRITGKQHPLRDEDAVEEALAKLAQQRKDFGLQPVPFVRAYEDGTNQMGHEFLRMLRQDKHLGHIAEALTLRPGAPMEGKKGRGTIFALRRIFARLAAIFKNLRNELAKGGVKPGTIALVEKLRDQVAAVAANLSGDGAAEGGYKEGDVQTLSNDHRRNDVQRPGQGQSDRGGVGGSAANPGQAPGYGAGAGAGAGDVLDGEGSGGAVGRGGAAAGDAGGGGPVGGAVSGLRGTGAVAAAPGAELSELSKELGRVETVEFPVDQLDILSNFKADADSTTGVVRGQQLQGAAEREGARPVYHRLGFGPIQVWSHTVDGKTVHTVVSGRHRLDLARRAGEQTIPAQVIREADGWTEKKVRALDAELNIKDEKGTVKDYVKFFTNTDKPEAAMRREGLFDREKGKQGWTISKHASQTTLDAFNNGIINPDQAVVIASNAPGNDALQRVGVKYASEGRSAEYAADMMADARESHGTSEATLDMFMDNDAELQKAEARTKIGLQIKAEQKKQLGQLNAFKGAAKEPALARQFGIEATDPAESQRQIEAAKAKIKADLDRWERWRSHPDLVAQVNARMAEPEAKLSSRPANTEFRRIHELSARQSKGELNRWEQEELTNLEKKHGQQFMPLFEEVRKDDRFSLETQMQRAPEPALRGEQLALFSKPTTDPRVDAAIAKAAASGRKIEIDPAWGLPTTVAGRKIAPTGSWVDGRFALAKKTATLRADITLDDNGTRGRNPLIGYVPVGREITRDQLHEAILAYYWDLSIAAEASEGSIIFTGGGPAAGKSTLIKQMEAEGKLPPKAQRLPLSADDIKLLLPEAQDAMLEANPSWAGAVHVESQHLMERIGEMLLTSPHKVTVVWDATLSYPNEMIPIVRKFKDAGYKTHLRGILIDPWEAMVRAAVRGVESNRFIPPSGVLSGHKGFHGGFTQYFDHMDSYEIVGIMYGDDVYGSGGEGQRSIVVASTLKPVDTEAAKQYGLADERSQLDEKAGSREALLSSYGRGHPALHGANQGPRLRADDASGQEQDNAGTTGRGTSGGAESVGGLADQTTLFSRASVPERLTPAQARQRLIDSGEATAREPAFREIADKMEYYARIVAAVKQLPFDTQDGLLALTKSAVPKPSPELAKRMAPLFAAYEAEREKVEAQFLAAYATYTEDFPEAIRRPFDEALDWIARTHHGEAVTHVGIKGAKRAIEKAWQDAPAGTDPDVTTVKDALRATLIGSTDADVNRMVHLVKKHFGVIEPRKDENDEDIPNGTGKHKDRFAKPTAGYKDHLIQVNLPNGRMAEVQVLRADMAFAKEVGAGHRIYEAWRDAHSVWWFMARNGITEGKADVEVWMKSLTEASKAFYAAAENAFTRATNDLRSMPTASDMNLVPADSGGTRSNRRGGSLPPTFATGTPSISKNSVPSGRSSGSSVAGSVLISTKNIRDFAHGVSIKKGSLRPVPFLIFDLKQFREASNGRLVDLDTLISRKNETADARVLAGTKTDPREVAYKFFLANTAAQPVPKGILAPGENPPPKEGIFAPGDKAQPLPQDAPKRRAPLDVFENGDGTYTIIDGNASAQALMLAGWTAQVPVNIVPGPLARAESIAQGQETTVPQEMLGDVLDAMVGMPGPVNVSGKLHIEGTALIGLGLEIPRRAMPQVPAKHKPAFFAWLAERGIAVEEGTFDAAQLFPTQGEIDGRSVGKLARNMDVAFMRSSRVMISSDGYVIDGHHRWAAWLALAAQRRVGAMPVARIGREIREVLGLTTEFMQETGIPFEQMGEMRTVLHSRRTTNDPNQGGFDFGSTAAAPAAPAAQITPTAPATGQSALPTARQMAIIRTRLKVADERKVSIGPGITAAVADWENDRQNPQWSFSTALDAVNQALADETRRGTPAPPIKGGDRVVADEGAGQVVHTRADAVKISLDGGGQLTNWIPRSRVTPAAPAPNSEIDRHGVMPDASDLVPAGNRTDIEARWSRGEKLFAADEMEEGVTPITSLDMLAAYAPDQIYAAAPAAPAAAKEYAYGMHNRPRQIGAQPKDFARVDADDKRGRHGVIFYNRPLTEQEVYDFELKPLDAPPAPAAPAPTAQPPAPAEITDADVKRAMTGAERKRLKAAEALKERARGLHGVLEDFEGQIYTDMLRQATEFFDNAAKIDDAVYAAARARLEAEPAPAARNPETPLAPRGKGEPKELFDEPALTNQRPPAKRQPRRPQQRRPDDAPGVGDGDLFLAGFQADPLQPGAAGGVAAGATGGAGAGPVSGPGRPGRNGAVGDVGGSGNGGAGVSAGTDGRGSGEAGDGAAGGVGPRGRGADAGADRAADSAPAQLARPAEGTPERNAVLDPTRNYAPKAGKERFQKNLDAIKLMRELETAGRHATAEEKERLLAYTGWGWMKEAFNSVRATKWANKQVRVRAEYDRAKAYFDREQSSSYGRYASDPGTWEDYVERLVTDPEDTTDSKLGSWVKNYLPSYERLRAELTEAEFTSAAKSVRNAHFTDVPVIGAMWKLVRRLGFKGGNALEPGAGIGHFIGTQPGDLADRTRWNAVELDSVTARILAHLYPEATVNGEPSKAGRAVEGQGFQEARVPNNSQDLVISNVPFDATGPGQSQREFGRQFNLHNYFFARAFAKARPGGLVVFITSNSTMDNNLDQRQALAGMGELVGAIRLPNNAFKANAGTEVTTDIMVFRKPDGRAPVGFTPQTWMFTRELNRVPMVVEKPAQTGLLDWMREQPLDWLPENAQVAEAFTAWANGRRPATGQKVNALLAAIRAAGQTERMTFIAPVMANEYWQTHPEHALGEHKLAGSMYGPDQYALSPRAGEDMVAALNRAAETFPQDIAGSSSTAAGPERLTAARNDQMGAYVRRGDALYRVDPDGLTRPEWADQPEKVRLFDSWAGVRAAYQTLIELELDAAASALDVSDARARLNAVYDEHRLTVEPLATLKRNKLKFLADDPAFIPLQSLETVVQDVDPQTGKLQYHYNKAEIFRERQIRQTDVPSAADTIEDAVLFSMAKHGTLHPGHIAELLGISAGEAKGLLLENGLAFEEPATGMLLLTDDYLSGNVGKKLEAAIEAARLDPRYAANVEALQKALPPWESVAGLHPNPRANWVPVEVIRAFAENVLHLGDVTVQRLANATTFAGRDTGQTASDHETNRATAADILGDIIGGERTVIKDRVRDAQGSVHSIINSVATDAANLARKNIERAFDEYVKTSTDKVTLADGTEETVPDAAEKSFNRNVGGWVPPTFQGDWITLPGQSGEIGLDRGSRRSVLARLLTQGFGMIAHGVGSGKTYTKIALAMELRRLGKAQKPVIVVERATIGQYAAAFRKAYPQAKLLVAGESNFGKDDRARFLGMMQAGDWDAVIMTRPQVTKIPHEPSALNDFIAVKLAELNAGLAAAEEDSPTQNNIQGQIDALQEMIRKMGDKLRENQDLSGVTWEKLGVDALLVDEAHNYKNTFVFTTMENVKNLPGSDYAQQAISMELKTAAVRRRMNGKGIFFATGTPVSNAMHEAWVMMNYVAPHVLEQNGVATFDQFADTYGETVTAPEATWKGEVKDTTRFAKFIHGQSLINLIRSVFDVAMGNKALGLDVPEMRGGAPKLNLLAPTPPMERVNDWMINEVAASWTAMFGEKDENGGVITPAMDGLRDYIEDHPWVTAVPIMTMQTGIAAALDPRMIHDLAEDHPQSKVNVTVRMILAAYHTPEAREKKTTQVVFSDLRRAGQLPEIKDENKRGTGVYRTETYLEEFAGKGPFDHLGHNAREFDLYEDLAKKLVAGGIPRKEIGWIESKASDDQREAFFNKCNSGEIRVIIGGEGISTGVNIQERLGHAYHLMPPRNFKPAQQEQRNGRIVRQGNLWAEWGHNAYVEAAKAAAAKRGDYGLAGATLHGDPTIDGARFERWFYKNLPTQILGKDSPRKRRQAVAAWLEINDSTGAIRAAAEKAAEKYAVEIHEMGMEKSLDSAIYSMMAAKQGFVAQVLMGYAGSEFEDPTDAIQLQMAQMAAELIGDPEMIRKIDVERELKTVRTERSAWVSRRADLQGTVRNLRAVLPGEEAGIVRDAALADQIGEMFERRKKEDGDTAKPLYEFGDGTRFDPEAKGEKKEEGGVQTALARYFLKALADAPMGRDAGDGTVTVNGVPVKVTIYRPMSGENKDEGLSGHLQIEGSHTPIHFRGPASFLTKARNYTGGLAANLQTRKWGLAQGTARLEKAVAALEKHPAEFSREGQFQTLTQELAGLRAGITARQVAATLARRAANAPAAAPAADAAVGLPNMALASRPAPRVKDPIGYLAETGRIVEENIADSAATMRQVLNGEFDADGPWQIRDRAGDLVESFDTRQEAQQFMRAEAMQGERIVYASRPSPQLALFSRPTDPAQLGFDFQNGNTPADRVRANAGLVDFMAQRFSNIPGADQDDIRQQARVALFKAARGFDPTKGAFGPYAATAIRNQLRDLFNKELRYRQNEIQTLDAPNPNDESGEERQVAALPDGTQDVAREAARDDARDLLAQVITTLPDRLARAVRGVMAGDTLEVIGRRDLGGIGREGARKQVAIAYHRMRGKLGELGIQGTSDMLNSRPTTRPGDAPEWNPYEAIAALQRLAAAEQPGTRTIGRPDLALGANDPQMMGVDEFRKGTHIPQTREQWRAEGAALLARDRAGVRRLIIERGLGGAGLSAGETMAAKQLVADEMRYAFASPDPQARREVAILLNAYRETGKTEARSMGARYDELKTPEERAREFFARVIFTPPADVQKKIDEAPTPEEKKRLLDEDQKRVSQIEKELAKMGVSLADLLSGEVVLKLKGAKFVENTTRALALGAKEKEAVRMIQANRSWADIVKHTGLTEAQIKDVETRLFDEFLAKHLGKFKAGSTSANIDMDVLSSRPLFSRAVSDADALAEARRAFQAMGFGRGEAQGAQKFDLKDPVQVVKAARLIKAAGPKNGFDMLYELWINNILSGPVTHTANILGNAANAAWDFTIGRGMEAVVNGLIYHDPQAAQFGEAGEIVRGIVPGLARGAALAMKGWGAETDFFRHDVLGEPLDLDATGTVMDNTRTAIPGRIGRVVRISGRALLAADGFFKGMIGQMQVGAEAYRIAKAEGLTGDARAARIRDLVETVNSPAWQAAVAKATTLVFQDDLKLRREGGGIIEDIAAKVQNARTDNHLIGAVLPFVRTPYNIFKQGIRRSPLGTAALLARFAEAGFYRIRDGKPIAETYAPGLQVKHIAEQLLALGALALLAGAVQGDDDDDDKLLLITGSAPSVEMNRGERDLNERAYGGSYQIRIGGRGGLLIPFGRVEPFATVLGTLADTVRAAKRGGTLGEKSGALLGYMTAQAESKTFLQGLADFFASLKQPGTVGDKAQRGLLQAIVPNIIRQPLRNLDDYVRDWKGGGLPYMATGASGLAPEKLNAYGEPVTKTGSSLSRVFLPSSPRPAATLEPADALLLRWNRQHPEEKWAPSPLLRKIATADGERDMTGDEYQAAVRDSGLRVRAKLTKLTPTQVAAPSAKDVDMVKDAFRDAHREARAQLSDLLGGGKKKKPVVLNPAW